MAIHTFCSTASILVFMLCFRTGVAEIVKKPTGTEVVVGHSTYLNCSTNSPQEIHWFHTPVGSTQDRNFVYGYNQFYAPYIGRFAIENNQANDAYNLIIQSVKVEDAGQYECQDQNGQGKKESAQLTVLDTDPACEPRMESLQIVGPNKCGIEPGQLILSCTVKYHGNEAPIMKWRKTGDKNTISEGVTHQITDNNHVVYNLTIKENSTVNDGDSYFCNTTRSATLNDGCKSGKIKVKGTIVDATEICKPYIDAIICIIVLPIVVIGIVLVIWYFGVYRQKNRWQNATKENAIKQELVRLNLATSQATAEDGDKEKTNDHTSLVSSQGKSEQKSSKINDLKMEIRVLRKFNTEKDIKIGTLENEATAFGDKIEDKTKEIEKLHREIKQLKASEKGLEQRLYPAGNIDYAEKPSLVHRIVTDAASKEHKPISGMSILGLELFVSHENNSAIEAYDLETFQFLRSWLIQGISDPFDIASCKSVRCLYIIFREDNEQESHIMKLDLKGQLIAIWPTGGERGRLSTYNSNVIVCLFEKSLINEYTRDGSLIQTVRLSPAVGFNHPWHAIKVTSSHFAVCHGKAKDELHRVCIVDAQGNIIKELREWESKTKEGKLNVPICLVEDSERSILVADRDNQKIRLLNSCLKRQNNLIKKENKLDDYPVRICLDESKGRLFVAENTLCSKKKEWKDGRILVFNIK